MRYLVVAGGGGGGGITTGAQRGGGGGGAGGVLAGNTLAVTPGTVYTIEVGAGGTAGTNNNQGGQGVQSRVLQAATIIVSTTGGGGGASTGSGPNGNAGGSGGGGRIGTGTGGNGVAGQGNAGGDGGNADGAGGGGGAGAGGVDGGNGIGGNGGAGVSNNITGVATNYAGGGGGGRYDINTGGAGGTGGGGTAPNARGNGGAGGASTGGGGAGASGSTAAAGAAQSGGVGGSGVVILRYVMPAARYAVASNNWDNTATWSAGGCNGPAGASVPAAGVDVTICNTRNVTLNTNTNSIASLTIDSGGTLTFGSSTTARALTVTGDWTNNGTVAVANFNATHLANIGGDIVNNNAFNLSLDANSNAALTFTGGGSHSITGSGAMTLFTTTVNNNLTVNKTAGAVTQSGVFTVNGGLTVQAGTLNLANAVNVSGNTDISGTLGLTATTGTTVFTGAVTINSGGTWNNSSNEAVTLGGNLTNNGVFTAGTDTYTFSGGAVQSITGTNGGTTTFANLTLNNANGLNLTGTHNLTVSTTLTLTSGRVTTNANILYISSGNDIVSAGTNTFIVGNLRKRYTATGNQVRVFEVGTVVSGTPQYAPVSVRFGAVTTIGDYTITTVTGDHPNIAGGGLDASLSVNRYWTFTNGGVAFTANANDQLAFTFTTTDMDGAVTLANLNVGRFSGGVWTSTPPPTPTYASPTGTTRTVTLTGTTTLHTAGTADYQIAERDIPLTITSGTLICGSSTQVEVVFSLPVTPATAQNIANYALDGGVTISAAVLGADNRVVTLTTSALANGRTYTLTVNNVAKPNGTVIAPNSQATFFSEGGYLSGLRGHYFANMTLTGTAVQRVDGPVNFNWAGGTTGVPGIPADQFSVRWEGFVMPSATGNYTFRTRSDDGVRLYVNGVLVINNWTDHSATDNDSAAIALNAGQRYPVTMEFYENGGDAVAQLSWSGPDTGGFQFIPRSALSHFCGLRTPGAIYTLDEAIWNGTTGEVKDTSGNGLNGTAINGAVPLPAQVCNGAQLNGSTRYIQVPGLSSLLNATASLAFWIKTTQTGNDTNYEAPGVTGVEQSGGADDIFWGWLDASGRIGVSVGNTATTKSTVAINNGVWRHVVLTRDHVAGAFKIYIDGTLNTSGAIATGVIGTAFSSIGRIDDTGGTPQYLNGQLDEVRIYGSVLTDAEVLTIRDITRPCTAVFSHIRLEHNGTALTCEPANVTVKACADASCATLYTGDVTTVLSPTGWVPIDTISFNGGSTTAQLRKTTPGTVTLGAGTTSPAPLSGTLCFNGGLQTCDLLFQDTGFLFSTIPTQTAGTTSSTQTVRAVRKSDSSNVCVGLFNGNVNIDLASQCINPTTCQAGQQVTITNNGASTIAANPGAGVTTWTTKSMTFGANSTASFTLNYPDVGAIRLQARHNIAGSGDYMSGTSNDFVVKPAGFTVTNIRRTSDNAANPAATDAAGAVFIKAGENITLTATAVNSAGNATPNYGKETAPEGIRVSSALVSGLGLTANPSMGNNVISGPFSAGSATATNVSWSEVGIITITPSVGDTDYLGAGDVTGTTTGNVGRFTPHHFDVSINNPAFATACTAGSFTYVGQPFNYASGMVPVLTVTAKDLAGATTVNYKGTTPTAQTFFKLTNASLTGKTYTAATGTIDVSGVTGTDPVIVAGGNGTGTLTFSSGTGLMFTRSTPQAPFNAEISLAINVLDSDGVAYTTNPARFGQATAGNGIAFTASKDMRFGRLRVMGASGSQVLPLRVPFEAQYWTGAFFTTNTADTCTAVASNNVGLGNYIGSLNAGETTVTAVSALAAGRGQITLSAPGAANPGSVDLAINLGATANAAACPAFTPTATAGTLSHLRGQWCDTGYVKDPSVRARFGIRGGGDEQIYMRENFLN